MRTFTQDGQLSLYVQDTCAGKTSLGRSAQARPKGRTSGSSSRKSAKLAAIPFMSLDLTPGHGNLLGEYEWEILSPWRGGSSTLNTGVSPRDARVSSLSQILEDSPPRKYYLSRKACLGILRRSQVRRKPLPHTLEIALMAQAGLIRITGRLGIGPPVFHMNQRDESIDPGDVSGALMATANIQMHSFLSAPVTAFAANQRDEVRDLHDVAGALSAQHIGAPMRAQRSGSHGERSHSEMGELSPQGESEGYGACGDEKQQTFVAGVVTKGNGDCFLTPERHTALSGGGGQAGQGYPCVLTAECLNPWDTQQARAFLPGGIAPTLAGADGGGGRNPGGLIFTAGFCAGAGPSAGGIGYQEELAPTLKGTASGNMMPSVLCLNDQGGQIFENHGVDVRYTGPHKVASTLSARAGIGGNNLPLVGFELYQRQRCDRFSPGAAASTQSTRQHKEATDLVYQETIGTLTNCDYKGPNAQYVAQDKLIVEGPLLIRRLTPLECERLQGFPDGWTNLPGAADSKRYKALGNSVAVPCVVYIMLGIAIAFRCR